MVIFLGFFRKIFENLITLKFVFSWFDFCFKSDFSVQISQRKNVLPSNPVFSIELFLSQKTSIITGQISFFLEGDFQKVFEILSTFF